MFLSIFLLSFGSAFFAILSDFYRDSIKPSSRDYSSSIGSIFSKRLGLKN